MSENIRYMSRSILRSQSRPPVSNTDVMYFLFSGFTSFMITRITPAVLLLFLFLGPSVSATSASSLKNVLCLHLNCPCVSLTEVSERTDKKCREWYTVFYTAYMQDFQYCRLAGGGRVSYTNCKKKHNPAWSFFHSLDNNVMLRFRSSHRIHSICLPNSAAWDPLIFSISNETTFLLYVLSAIVLCHFIGWRQSANQFSRHCIQLFTSLFSTLIFNNLLTCPICLDFRGLTSCMTM